MTDFCQKLAMLRRNQASKWEACHQCRAIMTDDAKVSDTSAAAVLACTMVHCIVFGCNNRDRARCRGIRFFRLPLQNKPLLARWLAKLRLKDPPVSENSRLCSEHFEADCFERGPGLQAELLGGNARICLKPDAVPTIFTFTKLPNPRSTGEKRRRTK